jgi:hypothetical protein
MSNSENMGVCCQCQQIVPIHKLDLNFDKGDPREELMEMGEQMYGQGDKNPLNWVCDSHDAFGYHCEGSNTVPQAICKKKE